MRQKDLQAQKEFERLAEEISRDHSMGIIDSETALRRTDAAAAQFPLKDENAYDDDELDSEVRHLIGDQPLPDNHCMTTPIDTHSYSALHGCRGISRTRRIQLLRAEHERQVDRLKAAFDNPPNESLPDPIARILRDHQW